MLRSSTRSSPSADAAAKSSPPLVAGWPFVGNLPALSLRHLRFLSQARARYGDIFTVNFGATDLIMLAHPDYAHHVLVKHSAWYQDKGEAVCFRLSPAPMMGRGVAMTRGNDDAWRRQRRAMQLSFQSHTLEAMAHELIEAVHADLARWDVFADSGRPINVERELTRMILRVVGATLFGIPIEVGEADRLASSVRVVNDYIWWANFKLLLPAWIALPGEAAYQQALRGVQSSVDRIVQTALEKGKQRLLQSIRQHFVGELDEAALHSLLHSEATTLLVTGYESTAASLAWAFHLLATHPHVLSRLVAEIDEVLGDRRPSFEDVARLPYTRMVFQETLRLYPPSYWGAQRLCSQSDEIGGCRVPAGAIVAPVQYLIHHHPQVWTDPQRFDPLRFEEDRVAARHPLSWMPFGAGQRKCMAQEFALLNGQLVLAQVLQRYAIAGLPGRSPGLIVTSNLRAKGGVWLRLRARASTRPRSPCRS